MGTVTSNLESPSRRRSGRMVLRLNVNISGVDVKSNHFEERTETLEVSKYGAKLRLTHELKVGGVLTLFRPDAERRSQFRVIFQSPPDAASGWRETGIEFVGVDGFWGVQFPPDRSTWT
jgi:hypothetical protein